MREKKTSTENNKKTHRRRVWWWLFLVIIVIAGAATWVLYDGGIIGGKNTPVVVESVSEQINENVVSETNDVQSENVTQKSESADSEIRPACAVIEDTLLGTIVDDDEVDYRRQDDAAQTYLVLAQYGCPENAQYFTDMAARKQAIADGLAAAWGRNDTTMTSIEYLYSDEKICETIENRVMQNINTDAYSYDDFLHNANTYAVLYEYGCKSNKAAYMRAAVRELGVAVALMPTDKMNRDEIVTVVEICKSLGVAEAAHLMLQRLKARGYGMEFLLEMEDIIHGIR